jgi:hypothetical protein
MRVLIATDAWHPQVNGAGRTLTSLARSAESLGVTARRIDQSRPDAIHIATEGPIGHRTRAYCIKRAWPITTSYTTRFPEYIAARLPIPQGLIYAALRRFHVAQP